MEAEAFSALVANIYDAALDPPSWRAVLKDVCAFVRGGPSASLFWQDAVKRTGKTYYVWGGEARFNQLYWDKYVTLNPFTAAAGHFPVEEVYSAADVLPLPQFVETPFYKEWMTPQGWCDVLSANLDKSPTSRAVFSVARHARDGLVDDEMRRRMRLLVPHVRRSAMIGKLINLSRIEAAAMADTLDGLQAGMFLVDAAGPAGARQCERARDAERRQRAACERPAGRAGNPCRRSAERRLRRRRPWRCGARRKRRGGAARGARRRPVRHPRVAAHLRHAPPGRRFLCGGRGGVRPEGRARPLPGGRRRWRSNTT